MGGSVPDGPRGTISNNTKSSGEFVVCTNSPEPVVYFGFLCRAVGDAGPYTAHRPLTTGH